MIFFQRGVLFFLGGGVIFWTILVVFQNFFGHTGASRSGYCLWSSQNRLTNQILHFKPSVNLMILLIVLPKMALIKSMVAITKGFFPTGSQS
jgi:hypothetical protein